ncbi:helix-turn-helix domain-containing protein [Streptomyces sp. NPDC093149]|uniref:helix-turn-helix domain-containing protein n=1 Tax=Streptomyces sp. NPDC093149 TaxID=3366031 RepID=UPI00381FF758
MSPDGAKPGSTRWPERLSPPPLAALCDILDCSPADLIEPCNDADRRKRTVGEAASDRGPARAMPTAGT